MKTTNKNAPAKGASSKAAPITTVVQKMDHVKKGFDGLFDSVEALPEGKQKTAISRWLGDTYLGVAKTISDLTGGKFAIANSPA
jgi:hypothetical protein